jgi:hypothetical protein
VFEGRSELGSRVAFLVAESYPTVAATGVVEPSALRLPSVKVLVFESLHIQARLQGFLDSLHLELCSPEVAIQELDDAMELLAHASAEFVGVQDFREFADGGGEMFDDTGRSRRRSTAAVWLAP